MNKLLQTVQTMYIGRGKAKFHTGQKQQVINNTRSCFSSKQKSSTSRKAKVVLFLPNPNLQVEHPREMQVTEIILAKVS
jgi:hypothetical protein